MSTLTSAQAAIAQSRLTVTYLPLGQVRLRERSLRKHPKPKINKLARSIQSFGCNVPILVDPENTIIAGEARVLACRQLGMAEIATVCVSHLSDAQVRAFMIADNRLAELSSWDDQVLAETLQELSLLNLDFSLELTGFDMGEIDFRIESLTATKPKADKADELSEPSAGPPVTVPGDLWLLDGHRVLCGNALEPASYQRLMACEQAAMVFTDPPYNVPIGGHVSGLGAVQHREFAMGCGEMSEAEFTSFLRGVMLLLVQHSRDGSLHMICMDWRHMGEVLEAGQGAYAELKNLCVWAKDNAGMGSLYRSQHELVFVYKHGTAKHRNNVELGKHGRNRTNVWSYPGVNSFGRKGEEGNLLALHPTVKPVKLVSDAILDCTARGEVVLDAFLGSGSTLIAAEKVGRRCFGLELDPLYVDTVVRRWQAATGGSAIHAVTGAAFDDGQAVARGEGSELSAEPEPLPGAGLRVAPKTRKGAGR